MMTTVIRRKSERISATTGVGMGAGHFSYGHNVELELYPHTLEQKDVPVGAETMISIKASGMDSPVQIEIKDLKNALQRLRPGKRKHKIIL